MIVLYQLFRTVQLPATRSSIIAHRMTGWSVGASWSSLVSWCFSNRSFKHFQTKFHVVPGLGFISFIWGAVSSPAPRRPRNGRVQDHHAPPWTTNINPKVGGIVVLKCSEHLWNRIIVEPPYDQHHGPYQSNKQWCQWSINDQSMISKYELLREPADRLGPKIS